METYTSIQTSLTTVVIVGLFFIGLGYLNSKKITDNKTYIVGDRNENTFSLTASLTASALGAWILFGPASAATWGGIGAVIGYALGTAAPMLFLYNFGPKIRKEFPKGLTLTEFIKKRFGIGILKICLFLILFYLTIFLIAEVTAIASLLNFISQVPLWITAGVTLIICLLYILRGGFSLSIITDKYQFIFIILIILASLIIILSNIDLSSFEIIKKNSPKLINKNYLPNYTAGLTFFIAVAATNLFHQGNWQRVFSAKNNSTLKSSLIYSSIIIFFIVFWMGYSGLLSYSLNPKVNPDLAFFDLILNEKNSLIIIGILILAMSLTLSTIDTLINAISSLIIVSGNQINKNLSGKKVKDQANIIILLLSLLVFVLASKGYSILYLFLLADLLCCAAVITIFYGFFNKKVNSKLAVYSIFFGLISGLLFFPSQNFQSSILVGNLISIENFSISIKTNLLFISFAISLIVPFLMLLTYSLRNSFK
ncbi:sodium:solute symporter [Pelagibacteraceae bacterium]|nr:sodium:solute symporter [Pelagibacteraceae bacterium]MDC1158500.1 sodium:solute symporter [Pelagibacteraceae bacterium]